MWFQAGFVDSFSWPHSLFLEGGCSNTYSANNSLIVAAALSMESKWRRGTHKVTFHSGWNFSYGFTSSLGIWPFMFSQASSTTLRMAKMLRRSSTFIQPLNSVQMCGFEWNDQQLLVGWPWNLVYLIEILLATSLVLSISYQLPTKWMSSIHPSVYLLNNK